MTTPLIPISKKPSTRLTVAQLFHSITLQEWITTSVLATALGVAYWAWTLVYDVLTPFLQPLGLQHITYGLWILGSVFLSDLIRKPGIALFASILAAFVESLITQWGISAVFYGVAQGIGAELIFILFAYRNWSLPVLSLAAAVSAIFSYTYDYYKYAYDNLTPAIIVLQISVFIISAIILGACLSRYLTRRLLKTGLLDNFLVGKQFN